MKDLLEKNNLIKPPKVGEIIEGQIIDKGKSSLFLDLSGFKTGVIYGREYQEAREILKSLKIGDKIFAKIIDLENEEGYVELSASQAGRELAWENLRQKKEKDETLKIKVLGANKGGLLAEVSGMPAFLPVSQLTPKHYPKVGGGDYSKILRELQKLVGKELEVKIFDFSQREEKIILSERTKEDKKIKEALKNYKVGEVVEGEITAVLDFGAFMKFQKEGESQKSAKDSSSEPVEGADPELVEGADPEFIEGLIHISELDWQLIENPSKIVKAGEKVKAKIIDITDGKVSLSLKALKKDPWDDIEKKYKKGDVVCGKVTKFNPFGAFVQISPEIQGLAHISEFGTNIKMQDQLKIGEEYDFHILSIKPAEHRMSLKPVEK